MSTAGDVILELRNVTKSFGPVLANDNVSLALRRGQIHGLVGENGSGKSTIIRTLSGAHQPDSGNLFHDGAPIVLDSPLAAREIGVATVPGSSFFQDKELGRNYTRFCFCKRDETLDLAAERLRALRVLA